MKYLILSLLTLSTLCLSQFAVARTNQQLEKFQTSLRVFAKQAENGKTNSAFWTGLKLTQDLIHDLKIDELTLRLNESLQETRQEVIKQKSSSGAEINILGLLHIRGHDSYNVTQILTTNPQEVAAFKLSKQNSIGKMKSLLKDYVAQNQLELFYLKIILAKTVQLASSLPAPQLIQARQTLQQSLRTTQSLIFTAETEFLHCIRTEYAAYTNSMGINFSGILLSGHLSSTDEHFSYSHNVCKAEKLRGELGSLEIQNTRLAFADLSLEKEIRHLELQYFKSLDSELYLDWGSPYLN